MTEQDEIVLNTSGLDQLVRSLKDDKSEIRVGILASSRTSIRSTAANATIGAKHEFGEEGLPTRSFLRIPIAEHMQDYLDKSGAFDPTSLKQVLKQKSMLVWMKKIGIVAEAIVADAFASGGFGKWKPSIMSRKKNHQTLVETQQLRNSIMSEVK